MYVLSRNAECVSIETTNFWNKQLASMIFRKMLFYSLNQDEICMSKSLPTRLSKVEKLSDLPFIKIVSYAPKSNISFDSSKSDFHAYDFQALQNP